MIMSPKACARLFRAALSLCMAAICMPALAITVLNVKKDFGASGNGRTDDTQAFLAAVKEVNRLKKDVSLVIPPGNYQVRPQSQPDLQAGVLPYAIGVLAFEGCANLAVSGSKGTRIIFANGLYYGSFRMNERHQMVPLGAITVDYRYRVAIGHGIALRNCSHVMVSDIELDGNNEHLNLGSPFGDTGYQIDNDGLFIENSSAVTVKNSAFHHFGRDGFLLLNQTPQGFSTPGQNIVLNHCRFDYNGRQGFSWVGGVGVQASDCSFSYTARGKVSSAPRAGVDFEPNAGYIAKDGLFTNCTFYKNVGIGIINDEGGPYVRDFRFINCKVTAGEASALWIKGPMFRFTDCDISGCFLFGCAADKAEDGTRFTRCRFTDKGSESAKYNYLVESNGARYLLFDSCSFHVSQKVWCYLAPGSRTEAEKPVINSCSFVVDKVPLPPDSKAGLYATQTRFTGNTSFTNFAAPRLDWNIATSTLESWQGRPANIVIGAGFSLRTYETITIGGGGGPVTVTAERGGGLMIYHNAALSILPGAQVSLKRGGGLWLGPGVTLRADGYINAADGAGVCIHEAARLSEGAYRNIRLASGVSFGDNEDVHLNLNTCKPLKR